VAIHQNITPENTEFVILSFEGPDLYSSAGGLGTRVTNLSQALADQGFSVHFFFIGDPDSSGEEVRCNGNLTLHRWCQWISKYYPAGVYQGEKEKLWDFNESVPRFVIDHIVKPALTQDKLVVVLGEEWQTAEAMCRISDMLGANGLRHRVVMFWNANNIFGFQLIDWRRLSNAATITTVSRYMKQLMLRMGLGTFVIPNGIPKSLVEDVDEGLVTRLRRSLDADLILAKVARWDPDKRWDMAVEATAMLKARGLKTVLLARGGIEPYGGEVINSAQCLGLTIKEAGTTGDRIDDYFNAIEGNTGADMINIRFHCPQEFLRVVYRAADAVLANSGHEPFGLVGLETMAAGGIAYTGSTGEDYVIPFHNAIVLETPDPGEIECYVTYLEAHPQLKLRISETARETASMFTWEEVIKNLTQKLEYQARVQGLLAIRRLTPILAIRTSEASYIGLAREVEAPGVAGIEKTLAVAQ